LMAAVITHMGVASLDHLWVVTASPSLATIIIATHMSYWR
jgi:hypothetical protein